MDNILRFSDYDVFAYLVSGFAALALWDALFGTHLVIGAEWSVAEGLFTLVGAYVLGQILASPAAWLLERGLVRRVLGRPAEVLMADKAPRGFLGLLSKTLLREYYTPLPQGFAQRLRRDLAQAGSIEGLFWQAMASARANASVSARLDSFLRLYGFCRNVAFIAFIGVLSFAAAAMWQGNDSNTEYLTLCLLAGLVAAGMTHRYLKFHRLYTLEAFIALAGGGEGRDKEALAA